MSVTNIIPLLYVADPEASLAFYEGALGFTVVQQVAPDAGYFWCQLESGGARLMLNSYGDGRAATLRLPDDFGCILYFGCDDVHALTARLREKGYEVTGPEAQDYGLDQIFLRDPDGLQVCLTSPTDFSRQS